MLGLYLSLPSRLGWAFWASSLALRRFCLIWVVSSCCLIEVFMERSWKSCCCCSVCRLSVNRCCSYIRVQKRAMSGLCYIHECFNPFRFQVNYLQVLKSSDYVWAVCSDSSFAAYLGVTTADPLPLTPLSHSPSAYSSSLNPWISGHPLSNVSTVPPLYMSKWSLPCLSNSGSKLLDLSCPLMYSRLTHLFLLVCLYQVLLYCLRDVVYFIKMINLES